MDNPFSAIQIIAERKISEAIERGEFDGLPGAGKPLPEEDLSFVPQELRMAYKLLANAGCLPPELADRKEMDSIIDLLENCEDEKERLRQMRRLRVLVERMASGKRRHMALEQNDLYYQKVLACLARNGKSHTVE